MRYRINRPPSVLKTKVMLPASKSISNRLLILHALASGDHGPGNLSDSDDTRLMRDALESDREEKDIGHAGTAMRFLTAYYSCHPGTVIMTGSQRMKERPIGVLVEALGKLGASIEYLGRKGYPPLRIRGSELKGGELVIDGTISSQFISALLMIAPVLRDGLILTLKGSVVSSAYIQMTLSLMERYGARCKWEGETITVQPGGYTPVNTTVESDWSAASYWYSMALLSRHAHLEMVRLERDSLQGDRVLVDLFRNLGVVTSFGKEGRIRIEKIMDIIPPRFTGDFSDSPDLVQSMAVALCFAGIPFRVTGTQTLRIKETDRIAALQQELRKLGFVLRSDAAGQFLAWEKETVEPEADPVIATYNDHRMAMAFAPVALAEGSVLIDDPGVVSKSYPGFWEDLRAAGFSLEEAE